ncbi:MAG: DUF3885 domain-containing protein [Clostridiales bacterium]|nr:DUF3885 domain-containing protein [Clostridiales bacterium]
MLPIITFNDKDVASTVYLLRNFSYNNDRLFRFCFFGLADSEIIFCDTKFKRVLNIYDNRGCDVVIDDKKFLKEVYLKYSDWILQYNREEIKAKLDIKE